MKPLAPPLPGGPHPRAARERVACVCSPGTVLRWAGALARSLLRRDERGAACAAAASLAPALLSQQLPVNTRSRRRALTRHQPRMRLPSMRTFASKALLVILVLGVWKGFSITCGHPEHRGAAERRGWTRGHTRGERARSHALTRKYSSYTSAKKALQASSPRPSCSSRKRAPPGVTKAVTNRLLKRSTVCKPSCGGWRARGGGWGCSNCGRRGPARVCHATPHATRHEP